VKLTANICTLAAAAALLAGCGGGNNGGAVPTTTQANLGGDKVQLAVGTAYNAADTSIGLNVVTTFRQPNGFSATLANTPSITGPAGFAVPGTFSGAYGSGNVDAGTATISSSPQVNLSATPVNSTLGTFTGAFSYGLAPLNSDQQGAEGYFPGNPNATPANGFSGNPVYDPNGNLPFWEQPLGAAPASQALFLVGPPAVPFFNNGTFPGGFAGYSPGFTAFEIAPVAGTYTETVKVTPSNAAAQSFTATANLASTAVLSAPVVAVTSTAGGGLAGTVTVGAGATETLVFIRDTSARTFYTVEVTGTGAQTWTLPATLGACNGASCENNAATQAPSLAAGAKYTVQAVSFDYPALEAGPPSNTSQTPTLTGASGQADLAIGLKASGTY